MKPEQTLWSRAGLLAWLLRHPDALEPGLRLDESGIPLELPLKSAASGPDPLGRPCFLLLFDAAPETAIAESLIETAARLREAQPALEAWYARPAEPRILLLAPDYPLALRSRLALFATGISLQAWSFRALSEQQPAPTLRLEWPTPSRYPSVSLPSAPPDALPRLRRLMLHAGRIQPAILAHGGGWPISLTNGESSIGVLHRDGDEVLFVAPVAGGRAQVLRLEDEESVDRALDALQRSQFVRTIVP